MNLPTLREVTTAVRNLVHAYNQLNERLNNLAKSQLEMTIVLNALRKKGLLDDEDVQEAWDEFQTKFDEDQKDSKADSVESEGQDADLGSPDDGGSGLLSEPGDRDADNSEAEQEPPTQADG